MIKTENFEKVEVKSKDELRKWLSENFASSKSFWLVTFKKTEPDKYLSTGEILDELLSFGWIDGIRRKLDDKRTMQLISPRKTQHWTATYKTRAKRLIEQGKMTPAGLDSITHSKKVGLWNFMDDVDQLIVPKDLSEALIEKEGAFEFFENINDSSKRFVLRWIKLAKTEKTRKKRILQITSLSAKGEKLPGS